MDAAKNPLLAVTLALFKRLLAARQPAGADADALLVDHLNAQMVAMLAPPTPAVELKK